MNLTKAIEILTVMQKEQVYLLEPDGGDAVLLSIEALKRLGHERSLHTYPAYKLLPGETEE